MTRSFRHLLRLSLCTLLCAGCHKPHSFYLTNTSRQYFSEFRDGSYWVYRNEDDPADIDTLTLSGYSSGLRFEYTESPSDGDYFERVDYVLVSSKSGDTLQSFTSTGPNSDTYFLKGKYRGLDLFCVFNPNKHKGEQIEVNTALNDTLKTDESYMLHGKTYSDVVTMIFTQMRHSIYVPGPSYSFARHDGLIGFRIYDESSQVMKRFGLIASSLVK